MRESSVYPFFLTQQAPESSRGPKGVSKPPTPPPSVHVANPFAPPALPSSQPTTAASSPFNTPATLMMIGGLSTLGVLGLAHGQSTGSECQRSLRYYLNASGVPQVSLGNLSLMDAMGRAQVFAINVLRVAQAWMSNQHKWERLGFDAGQNWANLTMLNFIKGGLNDLLLDALLQPKVTASFESTLPSKTPSSPLSQWWKQTIKASFQQSQGLAFSPEVDLFNPLKLHGKQRQPLKWAAQDTLLEVLKSYRKQLQAIPLFEDKFKPSLVALKNRTTLTPQEEQRLLHELQHGVATYCLELQNLFDPKTSLKAPLKEALLRLFDAKTGTFIHPKQEVAFEETYRQTRALVNLHLKQFKHLGPLFQIEAFDRLVQSLMRQAPLRDNNLQRIATQELDHWLYPMSQEWEQQCMQNSRELQQAIIPHVQAALREWKQEQQTHSLLSVMQKHLTALCLRNENNELTGELGQPLERLYRLTERKNDLNNFQNNRNKALLAQNAIQTLITCLVIGNALSFIVFNSIARLDADFDDSKQKHTNWNLKPLRKWLQQLHDEFQVRSSLSQTNELQQQSSAFTLTRNKLSTLSIGDDHS
ncbi:MAG: hypothetical protein ACKO34_04695 [Vampirovibrionales bacterium]